MRFPKKTIIVVVIIVAVVFAGRMLFGGLLGRRNADKYRHAEVTGGNIIAVVNATGTVEPVKSVAVGSFVSGPITDVYVDHNEEVEKDQLLAKIDPKIYETALAREQAILLTRKAEQASIEAKLRLAINDQKRSIKLRKYGDDFISEARMDEFKFNRESLAAQKVVAEKAVDQAKASFDNAKANLDYTYIKAPEDGIIIERKVNEGQTVASQFQTPELFVIAPKMREKMYINASVDEADIGLIRAAADKKLPVPFTVEAYPDVLFTGTIYQIRYNATVTQNVVTYPVIVETKNPDLKLLPKMTASLSFQVDSVEDVLRIPNAALRFFPKREEVRPEDRKILDGIPDADDEEDDAPANLSAIERAKLRKGRHKRHVWIEDGEYLKAIPVVTGISDNRYTQLVSGELKDGQKLVIGTKKAR